LKRHIGVLQRLQGFDGAGKGAGENLAGMEEVFVTFSFISRGAVGFTEVDVGGVNK